jgi:hypothetical protein
MVRAVYSQGVCANCGDNRLLKYAKRTMCCRYRCQKAASALRAAQNSDADDSADAPTFCYVLHGIEGQRFADPDKLSGYKRRNKLANADRTLQYLAHGDFGEDADDNGITDTRWVEYDELLDNIDSHDLKSSLSKYRKMEKDGAEKAERAHAAGS